MKIHKGNNIDLIKESEVKNEFKKITEINQIVLPDRLLRIVCNQLERDSYNQRGNNEFDMGRKQAREA